MAIEFYAKFCGPCQNAIPKWEELQNEYGDKGLTVVVVLVSSGGGCVPLGWNPDKIICDYEGEISTSQ